MRMSRRAGLIGGGGAAAYEITVILCDEQGVYEEYSLGTYQAGSTVNVDSDVMGWHPDYGTTGFYFYRALNSATQEVYATSTIFVMPNFNLTLEYTI